MAYASFRLDTGRPEHRPPFLDLSLVERQRDPCELESAYYEP